MDKLLVLYSSHDGQVRKIIATMREEMAAFAVEERDLHQDPKVDFANYKKVLIGASIRYGHFNPSLYRFIKRHHAELLKADAAFFGVNLTARKPEKSRPETNAYMRKFLQRSLWQPKNLAVFAGALRYSKYNWWQTKLIQLIMTITGGSTDKRHDIEFTDWSAVRHFATTFINAK